MEESNTNLSGSRTKTTNKNNTTSLYLSFLIYLKLWIVPTILAVAVFLFLADPFDPAPFPMHELAHKKLAIAPKVNSQMLKEAEFVGLGQLLGPEDVAYEPRSGIVYTGCVDGWIKRVKVGDLVVEDWVNTGGRPLGIAISKNGYEIIVADSQKGLLNITKNKEIKVLTNQAEGQEFKLTDGVDIARDGTIYFTDASYKYEFKNYLHDLLECRPYGRLLSFNPNTRETEVLLRDLYFPNGVAVSHDQNSVIFCETPLKRCRRYWIQGDKKGAVDSFVDNLPGFPDNIHSDGQSNYWIAISSKLAPYLEQARAYRLVRKAMKIMDSYNSLLLHQIQSNGGILGVNLKGNPTMHVYDKAMSLISSGIKIEDHLYIGSLHYNHIIRFNLSYA